jgi:plastocyanin
MTRTVGARGLAIAALVLAASVATPALSAAQDGTTTSPDSTTTPDAGLVPAPPEQQAPAPKGPDAPEGDSSQAATPAPASPAQPAVVSRSAGGEVASASASASVSIGDNFYSPASVSVAVGDTVTWANNGQAQHSATADDGSFDTGVFGPGGSRSHTFTQPGTFSYFCTVHGQVQSGTVRVLAASGGGGGGGGGSAGSSGSGTSEADAVASSDAAGTSSSLAATGLEALGLTAIGIALLAGGIALRRRMGLSGRPPMF